MLTEVWFCHICGEEAKYRKNLRNYCTAHWERHVTFKREELQMYNYKGKVVSVYDADTITIDFDLGFKIHYKDQQCRIYGIDTPELRTKNKKEKELGYKARDYVRKLILGKELEFTTHKDDKKGKFGRYLVDVVLPNGKSLAKSLVKKGYAREYHGEKKKPWVFE